VVPSTPPREQLTWTEGRAEAITQRRLDRALARFHDVGAEADGEVGDKNPILAIRDALQTGRYDEIILSTLPPCIEMVEAGSTDQGGRPVQPPGDPPDLAGRGGWLGGEARADDRKWPKLTGGPSTFSGQTWPFE
jgi:hypothetical protein